MNQDRDEKALRALFHEVRTEDERNASSFAYDWQAAVVRQRPAGRSWGGKWVIAAASALLVVCASLFLLFRNTLRTPAEIGPVAERNPALPRQVNPVPFPNVVPSPIKVTPSQAISSRSRRRKPAPAESGGLISQWRSPTDFLLAFPADRLLKSVPRLDDSIVDLKTTVREQ